MKNGNKKQKSSMLGSILGKAAARGKKKDAYNSPKEEKDSYKSKDKK